MRVFLLIWIIINDALGVPVKTNKNEVTREFDEITNKATLDSDIESSRNTAISSIGQGAISEVFIPNESAIVELKIIDEDSLESKAREVRYSKDNIYFDEFETDYTKPGAIEHKKDIDEIVNATEKKLQGLTELLRKNGIDCKEEAKNKTITDPYYINIERTPHKEVEYDQHFCEYPRNTYNCHDNMTIHCEQRNWKYHVWSHETRWIFIPGGEVITPFLEVFLSRN